MATKQKSKTKRIVTTVLVVLLILLLAAGGALAYIWFSADETVVTPQVQCGETGLPATVYSWHTPLLGGRLEKHAQAENAAPPTDAGTFSAVSVPVTVPQDVPATLTVLNENGETVFDGTTEEYANYTYTANGTYTAELHIAQAPSKETPYGEFTYAFLFAVDVQPHILLPETTAQQGDIITAVADVGLTGAVPQLESDFGGIARFVPLQGSVYVAYIPVNYNLAKGDYNVTVTLGDLQESETVAVTAREYTTQHMTISQDTTNDTMNNPQGPANWREKIWPLWEQADDAVYWTETFMQPCEARISTQFGLYRYTNDDPTPTRHTGIDIAADEGTEVHASNAGRVALAEYIIYTGNTVVIEHGGGLKTYYFHMSELDVAAGDMVEKGDVIGLVGTTGYSTGAHLHFEVKLGKTSLSPWELFDGTSEVYRRSAE